MSLQRFSTKKVRKLAQATSLDLQMVWNHSDAVWCFGRTYDHKHYNINRRTLEFRLEDNPIHMSSCPGEIDYKEEEWIR